MCIRDSPRADSQLSQRLSQWPELTVSRTTPTDIYYKRQPDEQELVWQQELTRLQEQTKAVENEVRAQLSDQIRQYGLLLSALLQALGRLDLLLAKVRLAPVSYTHLAPVYPGCYRGIN